MPRRVRVVDPADYSDESYDSSLDTMYADTQNAIVLTKSSLCALLEGGKAARKRKGKAKFTVEVPAPETHQADSVPETTSSPTINPYSPPNYKKGKAMSSFPFRDDEPIKSLAASLPPPPVGPTPYWRLPPRFQIRMAKRTFGEYASNNPKSRGRQGKLSMEVSDLLPAMQEVRGGEWRSAELRRRNEIC